MMRRAALLGNQQAIDYLQDRGLFTTHNTFVAPEDANYMAAVLTMSMAKGYQHTMTQSKEQLV